MSLSEISTIRKKTNLLNSKKVIEHLSDVSTRIQNVIPENCGLTIDFQKRVISDICQVIESTISSIQTSKTITIEELEGILFFDNPLIDHDTNFLETFFTELITDTADFSKVSLPILTGSFLSPSKSIPSSTSFTSSTSPIPMIDHLSDSQSALQLPSTDSAENDEFLTELLKSGSIKKVLKRFSLNLSSQVDFFANFESFDRFHAKLELFLYLGIRYCKIRKNPKTSATWYSEFLASCQSVGFDSRKGKGDHGTYYYPTINLDGAYKRNYFKLFNPDTRDSINVENIYKEIHLKLSNFAKYEFDTSIQDRVMRQNFYQYMLDLNKVINELITKLLESSELRKLYNI